MIPSLGIPGGHKEIINEMQATPNIGELLFLINEMTRFPNCCGLTVCITLCCGFVKKKNDDNNMSCLLSITFLR